MERTPFDAQDDDAPPEGSPFDSSLPNSLAPDDMAASGDASAASGDASAAARAPGQKRVPRWFWLALGAIALVLALAGAGVWAGQRAEAARLGALRERINAIVRNDNALVLEVLDANDSQHITYAEFFARTTKNKADRDTLIRKLRTLVAAPYQTEVDNLVRLLEIENDYVRAEEAVTRQQLEVARRRAALEEFADTATGDTATGDTATGDGLDAPYVAPSDATLGEQSVDASRQASAAFRKYKAAREAMAQKLSAASAAIDLWLQSEPKFYPTWAPPRAVTQDLEAKKRAYNRTPDFDAGADAPLNPDLDAPAPTPPDPTAPAATPPAEIPTPAPAPVEAAPAQESAPTEPTAPAPEPQPAQQLTPAAQPAPTASDFPAREDAPAALPGERFPQTRLRALAPDELRSLSDDDLRYATNEMFARYGQTFGDQNYQAQFESAPWYRANPRASSAKIRRAFTDREKSNLKLLIQERARRRASARGY